MVKDYNGCREHLRIEDIMNRLDNWLLVNNVVVLRSTNLSIVEEYSDKYRNKKSNVVEILKGVVASDLIDRESQSVATFKYDKCTKL